ncbi:MAG: HAD family hydrolase [Dehalococcoidia bacterium]
MQRIVLFDIDLTLVRTLGAGREAVDTAFRHIHGVERASEGWRYDGKTDYHSFRALLERHGVAGKDLDAAYERLVGGFLTALPWTLQDKACEVLPGAVALVDAVIAEHGGAGLATGNTRRGAAIKLGHFGLWERFAGGGFGEWTPDRAVLVREGAAEVATTLGRRLDFADVVVFGDTPHDVDSAVRAGGRGIGVATGRFTVDELLAAGASAAFPDLTDTDAVLAAIR